MLKNVSRIYTFILIFTCSFAFANNEVTCEKPDVPQEVASIITELNSSDNLSRHLVSHVFKTIPKEYVKVFYVDMTPKNRAKLWEDKIRNLMEKDDLTSEQVSYIEKTIAQMEVMQSLDLENPESLDYVNSFEEEAFQFFTRDQIQKYFYNIFSIVQETPKGTSILEDSKINPDQLIVTPNWGGEEGKPACNCRPGTSGACLGCAGGGRCRWVNRGCGFMGMGACSGLCGFS